MITILYIRSLWKFFIKTTNLLAYPYLIFRDWDKVRKIPTGAKWTKLDFAFVRAIIVSKRF